MITNDTTRILTPLRLGRLHLKNRAVVAPMTRVSADEHGVPTRRMAHYYADFAFGGFGLIITEGIYPEERYGPAYAHQPGLVTREQVHAWRDVTTLAHHGGAKVVAQLMHAGAVSQVLTETIAPFAVRPKGEMMPEYGGNGPFPLPRSMEEGDTRTVIGAFAVAARNAVAAGFDGVELHAANGYLLDQFITGGLVEFVREVITAVRAEIGADPVLGIRISQAKVNDRAYRWPRGAEDARAIFSALPAAELDYVHVAGEGQGWKEHAKFANGSSLTRFAKELTELPVIANGELHDPELADQVLRDGHADLVAIGRSALANPDWPLRLHNGHSFESFYHQMLTPSASIANSDRWLASRKV